MEPYLFTYLGAEGEEIHTKVFYLEPDMIPGWIRNPGDIELYEIRKLKGSQVKFYKVSYVFGDPREEEDHHETIGETRERQNSFYYDQAPMEAF